MTYDIIRDTHGLIEVRAQTPAYADYLYTLLVKHGHAVTRDRTNSRILFLKDPILEGFRTADQLLIPTEKQQRLPSAAEVQR